MADEPTARKNHGALTDEEVKANFPSVPNLEDYRDASSLYAYLEEAWQQEHMALVPDIAAAIEADRAKVDREYYNGFREYVARMGWILMLLISWEEGR